MAKKDVPMCFTERMWIIRAFHSWAYAQSPATSWQSARKKVVGEAVWSFWEGWLCW